MPLPDGKFLRLHGMDGHQYSLRNKTWNDKYAGFYGLFRMRTGWNLSVQAAGLRHSRTYGWQACLFIALGMISACRSAPLDEKRNTVALTLVAGANMNPNVRGVASPLKVSVYALNNEEAFLDAGYRNGKNDADGVISKKEASRLFLITVLKQQIIKGAKSFWLRVLIRYGLLVVIYSASLNNAHTEITNMLICERIKHFAPKLYSMFRSPGAFQRLC